MKKLLLSFLILLVPAEAGAIGRYASTSLSCAQVQGIARSQGAAIMRWSSARDRSLPLYVRVVRNRFQCDEHEFAGRGYVPTRDTSQCPVRVCKSRRQFAPYDPDYFFN